MILTKGRYMFSWNTQNKEMLKEIVNLIVLKGSLYSAIIISLFVKIFFPKAPIGIFYFNLALKARFSCDYFLHQTLASDSDEEACLTKLLSSARQTKYASILKIQC
jgi:hypothetical protein